MPCSRPLSLKFCWTYITVTVSMLHCVSEHIPPWVQLIFIEWLPHKHAMLDTRRYNSIKPHNFCAPEAHCGEEIEKKGCWEEAAFSGNMNAKHRNSQED